jgi:Domain of unknown function (DUF4189)
MYRVLQLPMGRAFGRVTTITSTERHPERPLVDFEKSRHIYTWSPDVKNRQLQGGVSHMLKYLIASLIFISAITPTIANARDSYGAIAYSFETGASAWAHSFSSAAEAENFVLNRCYNSADDCKSLWFKNACGAVAAGPDGWGSAWAPSSAGAQRKAIRSCSQYSDGCRVVRWQCSGARQ